MYFSNSILNVVSRMDWKNNGIDPRVVHEKLRLNSRCEVIRL